MCAAPGSKTSQMLEMIYYDFNKSIGNVVIDSKNSNAFINGGVICNDVDHKRAWMLTHQVKRINTAAMMVANHPGQMFPTLKHNKEKVLFDKV